MAAKRAQRTEEDIVLSVDPIEAARRQRAAVEAYAKSVWDKVGAFLPFLPSFHPPILLSCALPLVGLFSHRASHARSPRLCFPALFCSPAEEGRQEEGAGRVEGRRAQGEGQGGGAQGAGGALGTRRPRAP